MEKAKVEFLDEFYNLEGIHCKERKGNFFKLLHYTNPEVLAEVDIKPRNYLENIFYVDLVIRTKKVDKLIEILKEGNGLLTSKIIKQKWFFEEAFKDMSEENIVNEFLPCLSFSLRMKILKKMSLAFSEERNDKMFDHIFERYGIFLAQQFLFGCTSVKISEIFQTHKITLSIEQLKRILAKDSNLVKTYFDEYKKNHGRMFGSTADNTDNGDFLSYLVWKYPHLYSEFMTYLDCPLNAGRLTTKALLKTNEKDILENTEQLPKRFHIGVVTRNVKDFHKEYLHKYFPKKIDEINDWNLKTKIEKFLNKYPKKIRWNVFSEAFQRAYDTDVLDHLEILNEHFMLSAPINVRAKWAVIKYKKSDDTKFLKFFDKPKEAIALLKDKINVTSDRKKRCAFVQDMMKVCSFNKDYETYEEVLKYVLSRHKNEDTYTCQEFFSTIVEDIDYELSTEGFCKCLNDFVELSRAKGDHLPYRNMSQYITFLIKKNLPYEKTVEQFFTNSLKQKYVLESNLNYFDDDFEVKRVLMIHMANKLAPALVGKQRKEIATWLLKEIFDFNQKYNDFWIDLNEVPIFTEYLQEIFAKKNVSDDDDVTFIEKLILNNFGLYDRMPVKVCENELLEIVKAICNEKTKNWIGRLFNTLLDTIKFLRITKFEANLLESFFNELIFLLDAFDRKRAIEYFIRNEPVVILKYFDKILQTEDDNSLVDYHLFKLYSHVGFDEKLINHVKPLVDIGSTCENKKQVIENLSKLMGTEDFINLISAYIPTKAKLDLEDEQQKEMYEVQCALSKNLTNLDDFAKIIPLLYPFCQGDYLQSSLAILYKTLYRISETQAAPLINTLMERAVSTRKHAVFLGFNILPEKSALVIFDTLAAKETNTSAKKYLFQGILKYFLKNPEESVLYKVCKSMSFIDKNDKELLEDLAKSFEKVPIKWRPIYFENTWDYLTDIEKREDLDVSNHRTKLFSAINKYDIEFYSSLKDSFCQKLLKKCFFSNDSTFMNKDGVFSFVVKYLLAYKDDKHFEFVFDIIQSYKDRYWETYDDNQRYIIDFFQYILTIFVEMDIAFFNLFETYWERTFKHEESFSEYILLKFMILYKKNPNIDEFAKQVSKSLGELITEYGPFVNNLLLETVRQFYEYGLNIDGFSNQFAFYLLKADKSDINCYIAASIIDDDKKFEVVDNLKTVDRAFVRILCHNLIHRCK
ncbi:unnamed protein product [Ceutorhynchus assimilis]|uniref:Uncharacterized protein n=1 Tax=Ceutorhynchus assimilis TaxID=467358 RepID=A0A9N9MXZ4_9CUCU|nr:unnamed protein product [Ceutorhynchus assimilis]